MYIYICIYTYSLAGWLALPAPWLPGWASHMPPVAKCRAYICLCSPLSPHLCLVAAYPSVDVRLSLRCLSPSLHLCARPCQRSRGGMPIAVAWSESSSSRRRSWPCPVPPTRTPATVCNNGREGPPDSMVLQRCSRMPEVRERASAPRGGPHSTIFVSTNVFAYTVSDTLASTCFTDVFYRWRPSEG